LSGRAVCMNFSRADGDNQLRCPFFQKSCFYTTFENAEGLKACVLSRFLPLRTQRSTERGIRRFLLQRARRNVIAEITIIARRRRDRKIKPFTADYADKR
jgi:hypothetical protein